MKSAVEADLGQLGLILGIQRRFAPEIDTSEIAKELGERLREELDYEREARHAALYRTMLAGEDRVRVPETFPDLSTGRLLTMSWLDGKPLLGFVERSLEDRNAIARALFSAWWGPFARYEKDLRRPHLGNYTVSKSRSGSALRSWRAQARQGSKNSDREGKDIAAGRHQPARLAASASSATTFAAGGSHRGLRAEAPHARRTGTGSATAMPTRSRRAAARFIHAPLLDDRVRTIADGPAANLAAGARLRGEAAAEAEEGDHHSARVRSFDRAPSASAPSCCTSGRAQLPPPVRGGDRRFRRGRARQAAGRVRSAGSERFGLPR
jgi:predicted unusual protein kinase regulating ubiquinone biosynthesis (AarF/ABC1/UbiB family)